MTQQPKALRLADELERTWEGDPAADELRRQHDRIIKLEAALRQAVEFIEQVDYPPYDERPIITAAKQALEI